MRSDGCADASRDAGANTSDNCRADASFGPADTDAADIDANARAANWRADAITRLEDDCFEWCDDVGERDAQREYTDNAGHTTCRHGRLDSVAVLLVDDCDRNHVVGVTNIE